MAGNCKGIGPQVADCHLQFPPCLTTLRIGQLAGNPHTGQTRVKLQDSLRHVAALLQNGLGKSPSHLRAFCCVLAYGNYTAQRVIRRVLGLLDL